MKQFTTTVTLLLVFLLSFALVANGQTTKGTIAGVVTDSTGAAVNGATVTATASAGGDTRSAKTGSNGEYRLEALNPGTYTVSVEMTGFATTKVERVVVSTSVITSNNVQLSVAGKDETITVEASAIQIQTESGEISKTIPQVQIKDLPYGGNAYSLATTLAGVVTVQGRDSLTNGTGFSVNGLRPRSNNFLIDGFDNNDNGIAGQGFQPLNMEAVQEVTVLTNSYSAEFGRGGGSVSNLTYRSGSNAIHGAVWDRYSGSGLDALTSEEAANGLNRPAQYVNNRFGFRVGGPAIKNKLFWFGTTQWNRNFGAQAASRLRIPTAAGMTTLQQIRTGLAGAAATRLDTFIDAFGDLRSTVTANNPAQLVAAGNRAGCPAPCNVEYAFFTRTDSGKSTSREWTVRADYIPNNNDTFFVRYTDSRNSLTPDLFANPASLPYRDTQQGGPSRIFGTMWSHAFSPKALNEFRASLQLIDFTFGPTGATEAGQYAHLPSITLNTTGFAGFGGFGRGTFPQGRGHKTYQFQDAVSFAHGSQNFKVGADLTVLLIEDKIPFNFDGALTITGGGDCSAISLAVCTDLANWIDGFIGGTGSATKSFGNPLVAVPTHLQAYYFQGTWKVRPNLTLDYGVRYEYHSQAANNVLQYPAVNRETVLTDPLTARRLAKTDKNNFGPRVGFAWSPRFWEGLFGNDATVIRGGYGIFYDAFFTNINNNTAGTSPNAPGGTVLGTSVGGRGQADPFGLVSSMTAVLNPFAGRNSVTDDLINPQVHQWNLNVQRELPLKLVAEAAYVGTRGIHLYVNEQWNPAQPNSTLVIASQTAYTAGSRLNTGFGSIVPRTNGGDSNYHGLQTSLARSTSRMTIRGSYTWSRSIDNMSEVFVTSGGASRWQNVFNSRPDRAVSAFHRKHRAAISYNYALPFKSNFAVLDYLIGGWSTSGIISFQSGAPETIWNAMGDQNGDGETANDRPVLGNESVAINYSATCIAAASNCNTGVGIVGTDGIIRAYRPNTTLGNTGFVGTADEFKYLIYPTNSGVMGTVGRNSFYYPGRQDWSLSVVKRIPMKYAEGHEFEIRSDFFNAFNHPNLGVSGLNGQVSSPSFLDLNTTRRGGRQIQLWAKYSF